MKELIYNALISATGELSLEQVLLNFLAAAVLSALIFISYRVSHAGPLYSRRFNVSLVMMTLTTTLVMCVIGNNIALSLGMVGALSIVRFRTAIKDTRDTVYIFWTIAVGICCGVSDYLIAGIGSAIIFLFLLIFGFVRDNDRIMVVVRCENEALEDVISAVNRIFLGRAIMRVQNVGGSGSSSELIYEVSDRMMKAADKKAPCAQTLSAIEGVSSVSIVRQADEINQ